jgi:nitrogen fixation/metabolism regulation signal transduction histidine kinase
MALYFVIYQAAVWAFVVIERHLFATLTSMVGHGVVSTCMLLFSLTVVFIGFLFIYDAVKCVHRVVGPLYRFRKAIQAIAAGEEVGLLQLRKDDFLQEFKDDFNQMLEALERRGAITLKPADAGSETSKPVAV